MKLLKSKAARFPRTTFLRAISHPPISDLEIYSSNLSSISFFLFLNFFATNMLENTKRMDAKVDAESLPVNSSLLRKRLSPSFTVMI